MTIQTSLAVLGDETTPILTATNVITGSGTSIDLFELGLANNPDGVDVVFETATVNAQHTFTVATGTWLYWRITGTAFNVTQLNVQANT